MVLEPMAVIFGGGVEKAAAGMKTVEKMMGDFVNQYIDSLKWIGIDRSLSLSGGLASYR